MTPTESRSNVLLAVVLVAMVLISSPVAAIAGSAQDSETLEIEIEEGEDGDTVEVYLSSWLPNVAGVEAEIEYDPDVVQFEEAESVDLGGILNVNEDYEEDSLFISHAAAKSDAVDEPTMTKLTFEVVGEGEVAFEVVDDESTVFEVVETDGEKQLAENAVDTMPMSMSTDDLGEDTADDSDGSDSDSTDGSSGDDTGEGNYGGEEDGEQAGGDDDQQSTSGDGSDSSEDGANDDGADEDSSDSDESASESNAPSEPAGEGSGDDDSELISGIGLLAVVSGFLFAVAILARDQM